MLRRFSDKTIGRILSDKNIGSRFYCVKQNEWDLYNQRINYTYSAKFNNLSLNNINNNTENISPDTLIKEINEIKHIKMDINNLYMRMNKANIETDNIEKRLIIFSAEVFKILDNISKKE